MKYGARTLARFKGRCPKCPNRIELGDPIVGVYINGQGNAWDCKTMCGKLPYYVVNEDDKWERVPCVHYNDIHWIHQSCNISFSLEMIYGF